MLNHSLLIILAVLSLALVSCGESTNEANAPSVNFPELKTLQQRASYSYGIDVASRLRDKGVNLNINALNRGISDAYNGNNLALDEETRMQAKASFNSNLVDERARDVEEFEKLKEEAEAGIINSQVAVAAYYIEGKGVTQNHDEALVWLRKAADGGSGEAVAFLKEYDKKSLSFVEEYAKNIKKGISSDSVCDVFRQQIDAFVVSSHPDDMKVRAIDKIFDNAIDNYGCRGF